MGRSKNKRLEGAKPGAKSVEVRVLAGTDVSGRVRYT